jgi:hypothetical protein
MATASHAAAQPECATCFRDTAGRSQRSAAGLPVLDDFVRAGHEVLITNRQRRVVRLLAFAHGPMAATAVGRMTFPCRRAT